MQAKGDLVGQGKKLRTVPSTVWRHLGAYTEAPRRSMPGVPASDGLVQTQEPRSPTPNLSVDDAIANLFPDADVFEGEGGPFASLNVYAAAAGLGANRPDVTERGVNFAASHLRPASPELFGSGQRSPDCGNNVAAGVGTHVDSGTSLGASELHADPHVAAVQGTIATSAEFGVLHANAPLKLTDAGSGSGSSAHAQADRNALSVASIAPPATIDQSSLKSPTGY